jgi:hypothetical protein
MLCENPAETDFRKVSNIISAPCVKFLEDPLTPPFAFLLLMFSGCYHEERNHQGLGNVLIFQARDQTPVPERVACRHVPGARDGGDKGGA